MKIRFFLIFACVVLSVGIFLFVQGRKSVQKITHFTKEMTVKGPDAKMFGGSLQAIKEYVAAREMGKSLKNEGITRQLLPLKPGTQIRTKDIIGEYCRVTVLTDELRGNDGYMRFSDLE